MSEQFLDMFAVGGKLNTLGRTNDVIAIVMADRSRMSELYSCLHSEDAWVRMRAADALEKVCRQHPDWLVPYVDMLDREFAMSTQPSILWHMAQIYASAPLTDTQKQTAAQWLRGLLATTDVDWIVAANAMDALVQYAREGSVKVADAIPLLRVQEQHVSKAVRKKAINLLTHLEKQ